MQRLVINRTPFNPVTKLPVTNAKGEPLEVSFYLKNDPTFFQEEIIFRPIAAWPRYYTYDAYKNKYEGETIYIRSVWDDEQKKYINEEPIDNLGTLRLGRPDTEEFNRLDKFTQQMWRTKAKWQMCVFGIAYFNHKSEGVPVEFSYSGKKGMEISEMLKANKRPFYQNTYIVSLARNGDHFQPVFKKYKTDLVASMNDALKQEIKLAVTEVYKYTDKYNAKIRDAHEQCLTGKALEEFKKTTPVLQAAKTIDLDDEEPY